MKGKSACGLSLLFIAFLLCPTLVVSQEIDCDNTVYLSTHLSTGSGLYRFKIDPSEGITNLEEVFVNNPTYRFACIGYSVIDKMLYAIEYNTYQLLQINANGQIKELGVPNGLDTTLSYYAGEVTPGGRDFLIIGKNNTKQRDEAFYAVDLFDFRATPLSVISDGAVNVQAMARDPITSVVYAYDSKQSIMAVVNNGQVATYQYTSMAEQFTALFFDKTGKLYGLGETGGATSRKFFSIDKVAGKAKFLQNGPIGNDTDACTCPYTFDFFRKIIPNKVIPCGEVTIEYSFFNTSGSARTNLRILDELPKELTITEIVENTNAFNTKIISGIGTNKLDLQRMEVLLGTKSKFTIKATVSPTASGIIGSQAVLENLPLALNPKLLSDNPATSAKMDPNFLEIITSETPNFEAFIDYSCDNQAALITAPISNAKSFLWSDGSTSATLLAEKAGKYWVEMVTDCETYSDTFEVNFNNPLPYIDFGNDQIQDQGVSFSLNYETNLSNIRTYQWATTPTTALSCEDCPTPSILLLKPAIFSLTITDSRGCTTEDEIFIDINTNKQVFGPSAFSPNGDGINDLFYLQGTDAHIDVFRIFDRWGNLVFEHQNGNINDTSHAWKGDFKGAAPNTSVFIWYAKIEFLDGTQKMITGTTTAIK